jgi:hypothetical protein
VTCADRSPSRSRTSELNCPTGRAKGKAAQPRLLVDVAVWRAATGVDPPIDAPPDPPRSARPPTSGRPAQGPPCRQPHTGPGRMARQVFERVLTHPRTGPVHSPAGRTSRRDLGRAGIDAPSMVRRALAEGPLPGRPQRGRPVVAHRRPPLPRRRRPAAENDHHLRTTTGRPPPRPPRTRAALQQVRESSWWPTLVAVVDHAVARGGRLEDLLARHSHTTPKTSTPAKRWSGGSPSSTTRPPPSRTAPPGPTWTRSSTTRTTRSGRTRPPEWAPTEAGVGRTAPRRRRRTRGSGPEPRVPPGPRR